MLQTIRNLGLMLVAAGIGLFLLFGLLWPEGLTIAVLLIIAGAFILALIKKEEPAKYQPGRY